MPLIGEAARVIPAAWDHPNRVEPSVDGLSGSRRGSLVAAGALAGDHPHPFRVQRWRS